MHPLIPFITEEIYQRLPGRRSESIMVAPVPEYDAAAVDEESEDQMAVLMGIIEIVRNIRGETGIAPNVRVDVAIRADGSRALLERYRLYVKELARIDQITFITDEVPEQSAVGVCKGIEIFVPLKGLIDVAKELERIGKELKKIEEESEAVTRKLSNAAFREKAPPDVVQKNEAKYSELMAKKAKLEASSHILTNLSRG
jgi:valyl-tRNA synthetase